MGLAIRRRFLRGVWGRTQRKRNNQPVNAAICRALAKIPSERFSNCVEFIQAFEGTKKTLASSVADRISTVGHEEDIGKRIDEPPPLSPPEKVDEQRATKILAERMDLLHRATSVFLSEIDGKLCGSTNVPAVLLQKATGMLNQVGELVRSCHYESAEGRLKEVSALLSSGRVDFLRRMTAFRRKYPRKWKLPVGSDKPIEESDRLFELAKDAAASNLYDSAIQYLEQAEQIERAEKPKRNRKMMGKSLLLTILFSGLPGIILFSNLDDWTYIIIALPLFLLPVVGFVKAIRSGSIAWFPRRIGIAYLILAIVNIVVGLLTADSYESTVISSFGATEIITCSILLWRLFFKERKDMGTVLSNHKSDISLRQSHIADVPPTHRLKTETDTLAEPISDSTSEIHFTCIHCGQSLSITPDLLGLDFNCPTCGKPLRAPRCSENPPTQSLDEP